MRWLYVFALMYARDRLTAGKCGSLVYPHSGVRRVTEPGDRGDPLVRKRMAKAIFFLARKSPQNVVLIRAKSQLSREREGAFLRSAGQMDG